MTTVVDSTPPPPSTLSGDNSFSPPRGNPVAMGMSMYYSVTEPSLQPKIDNPPATQELIPSFKKLRRMTTFAVDGNSRMLVAVAQLLDAQLSIDEVKLTLSSRGDATIIAVKF